MSDQLQQLIRRFIDNELDYCVFRVEFVRFRTASDADLTLERLYNVVDSACAAFENGYISEGGMKLKLRQITLPCESTTNDTYGRLVWLDVRLCRQACVLPAV